MYAILMSYITFEFDTIPPIMKMGVVVFQQTNVLTGITTVGHHGGRKMSTSSHIPDIITIRTPLCRVQYTRCHQMNVISVCWNQFLMQMLLDLHALRPCEI